jgi:hypothetical protein
MLELLAYFPDHKYASDWYFTQILADENPAVDEKMMQTIYVGLCFFKVKQETERKLNQTSNSADNILQRKGSDEAKNGSVLENFNGDGIGVNILKDIVDKLQDIDPKDDMSSSSETLTNIVAQDSSSSDILAEAMRVLEDDTTMEVSTF